MNLEQYGTVIGGVRIQRNTPLPTSSVRTDGDKYRNTLREDRHRYPVSDGMVRDRDNVEFAARGGADIHLIRSDA